MHCDHPKRAGERQRRRPSTVHAASGEGGPRLGPTSGTWLALVSAALLGLASSSLLGLALPRPAAAMDTTAFPAPAPAAEPAGPTRLVPSPRDATVHLSGNGEDVLSTLEMELGKSVYLRTPRNVKRVSVGDPSTLDVVVLTATEVQLVPRQAGSTNVVLWTDAGRPIAAIDVEIGAAFSQLQTQLRRALSEPGLEVASAGGAIVLKGSVSSEVAASEAVRITLAYLGEENEERLVNLLRIGGHHQVMLEVVVAEMNRSVTREFGTNFNALIKSDGNLIGLQTFIGGLTQLDENGDVLLNAVNAVATFAGFGSLDFLQVFLDALDERGLSKVLAEPTLVARSGETASFLVGGEVPIPIAQGGVLGAITVAFKEFGIGLSFTPTVLSEDRIHLAVQPEVSEPDLTLGTEVSGTVVPAFRTRRAATAVELADGQSFAIAGLLSDRTRALSGQYPLLGQIPVLGALFRSSQYQQDETELVIIVTPRLVKPTRGPHPLPTHHYIEPNMAEFYLLGRIEGSPPPAEDTEPGGFIGDVGHRVSPDAYWSQY